MEKVKIVEQYLSLTRRLRAMDLERKRIGRKLKSASQAEILRSYQRDDDFIKYLREKVSDLLHKFQKQRFLRVIQSEAPLKLLYFSFTTGMGNQTLGEEYTGIIQAKLEARKVPSLFARIMAALLECFGETALLTMIEKLQFSVNQRSNKLSPSFVAFSNMFISKLRTMIPLFILIHKGLFYIYGRYYSLSRRIAGIDYAKVYGRRPADGVSWGLRVLGLITLIQCGVRICQRQTTEESTESFMLTEDKNSNRNCQLCLEVLPTTVTPCGHLFCWRCICDWLRTKSQCPLCREYAVPSRIVHLMNL